VAPRGDRPKKDNPRLAGLTGERGTEFYLAKRYFNSSPEEWDAMPWWLTTTYLNGLTEQGVIGDGNEKSPNKGSNSPGQAGPLVDYASGAFPPGFKTRRAG